MNKNFMDISKQFSLIMAGLNNQAKEKESPNFDDDHGKKQLSYVSIVDLDTPHYAKFILDKEDYVLAKHMKVNMPHFDGTDAEGW